MAHVKTRFEQMVNDLNDGEKQMLMELMFGRDSAKLSMTLSSTGGGRGDDHYNESFNNSATIKEEEQEDDNDERVIIKVEKDIDLIYVDEDDDQDDNNDDDEEEDDTEGPPKIVTASSGALSPTSHVDSFRSTDSTTHGDTNNKACISSSASVISHSSAGGTSRASSTNKGGSSSPVKTGIIAGAPTIVKLTTTKRSKDTLNANRLERYLCVLREDYIYNKHKQANAANAATATTVTTPAVGLLTTCASELSDTTSIKSGASDVGSNSNSTNINSSPSIDPSTSSGINHKCHSSRTIYNTLRNILTLVSIMSDNDNEQEDESDVLSQSSSLPRTMLCFLHKDGIFLLMQYIKTHETNKGSSTPMNITTSASEEIDDIRNSTVAVSIIRCLAYQLSTRRQELLLKENECICDILNCMNYYKLVESNSKNDWSKKDRQEGEGLINDEFYNVSDKITSLSEEEEESIRSGRKLRNTSSCLTATATTSEGAEEGTTTTRSAASVGSSSSLAGGSGVVFPPLRNLRERKVLHEECIRALYCLVQRPATALEKVERTTTTTTKEKHDTNDSTATIQFLSWKKQRSFTITRGGVNEGVNSDGNKEDDNDSYTTSEKYYLIDDEDNSSRGTIISTGTGDAIRMIMNDLKTHYTKSSIIQKYALGLLLHIFRDIKSYYRSLLVCAKKPMQQVVTLSQNNNNTAEETKQTYKEGRITSSSTNNSFGNEEEKDGSIKDDDTDNTMIVVDTTIGGEAVHMVEEEQQQQQQQQHEQSSSSSSALLLLLSSPLSSWQFIAPVSIWKEFVLITMNILQRYNKYASDSSSSSKNATTTTNPTDQTIDNATAANTSSSSVSNMEILQLGLMLIQRIIEVITYDCKPTSNTDQTSNSNKEEKGTTKDRSSSDVLSVDSNGTSNKKNNVSAISNNNNQRSADQGYITMTMMHYIILGTPNVIECLISILREHQRNVPLIIQCLVVLQVLCTIGNSSTSSSGTVVPVVIRDSTGSIASQNTTTATTQDNNNNIYDYKTFSSEIRYKAREALAHTTNLMCVVRLLNKHKNDVFIQREGFKLLRTLQNVSSKCFVPPVPDFFWNVPMHQTILKQAYLYGKVHRGRNTNNNSGNSISSSSNNKEGISRGEEGAAATSNIQQQHISPEIYEEEAKIINDALSNEYHMYYDNYVHVSYDIGIDDESDSDSDSNSSCSYHSENIDNAGSTINTDSTNNSAIKVSSTNNNNNNINGPGATTSINKESLQRRSVASSKKHKTRQEQAPTTTTATTTTIRSSNKNSKQRRGGPHISLFKRKKDKSKISSSSSNGNNKSAVSVSQ